MPRLYHLCPLALAAATFSFGAAQAQDRSPSAARFDQSPMLLANIRNGSNSDAYLENLLASLRRVDTDGDGLDREDVARLEQAEIAALEARHAARLERARSEFGRFDGNGDGNVSLAELEHAFAREASGVGEIEDRFRQADRNGDGLITIEDMPSAPRAGDAERLRQLDRDGDDAISLEELIAAIPPRQREMPNAGELFAERDANGDGQWTLEEALATVRPAEANTRAFRQRSGRFDRIFSIDADGDGRLTEAELTEAFLRVFNAIDANDDGEISAAEFTNAQTDIEHARIIAESQSCPLPRPSADAHSVAIATARGQLLSGLALGPQDEVTSIIDITIEPGAQPIQLILASLDPVIWRLTGATGRVENVNVFGMDSDAAGNVLAGVSGVSGQIVNFVEPRCVSLNAALGGRRDANERLAILLGAATGHSVSPLSTSGGVGNVSVPSLSTERASGDLPAPEGFDPDLWRDANRSWPRGVELPDASSITSLVALEIYDILPQRMGTAQLVAQGVIEPTEYHAEYRVLRPFPRFPAGMQRRTCLELCLARGNPHAGR